MAQDALGMPMWEYYDAHPETKATLTAHLDEPQLLDGGADPAGNKACGGTFHPPPRPE